MNHLLLTGATGLLGSHVMRDLLLARLPLAVLVRSTGVLSAEQRVEGVLQHWERQLGRHLPRPKVIEGNLHSKGLGIDAADQKWIAAHCDRLLNAAASVIFFSDARTGEPHRCNVEGVQHLLEVCRSADIGQFLQVSTAYVGGRGEGLAGEQATDVDSADFRCAYEESKAIAERLVRDAQLAKAPVVFRPSIIVGDSQTGFTPTYQLIYTALRLGYLHLLANLQQGWEFDNEYARQVVREQFIEQLGLSGEEQKNLVPVDWVSASIVRCVQSGLGDGQVINLTNPKPITVDAMAAAMVEAALNCWQEHQDCSIPIPPELLQSEGFRTEMSRYQVYFENDQAFERTFCERHLQSLTCPVMDHQRLVMMWEAAIKADFVWRAPLPQNQLIDLARDLECVADTALLTCELEMQLSGPGGGRYRLARRSTEIVRLPEPPDGRTARSPSAYLSSQTLESLVLGELSLEQAARCGLLLAPNIRKGAAHEAIGQLIEQLYQMHRAEIGAGRTSSSSSLSSHSHSSSPAEFLVGPTCPEDTTPHAVTNHVTKNVSQSSSPADCHRRNGVSPAGG